MDKNSSYQLSYRNMTTQTYPTMFFIGDQRDESHQAEGAQFRSATMCPIPCPPLAMNAALVPSGHPSQPRLSFLNAKLSKINKSIAATTLALLPRRTCHQIISGPRAGHIGGEVIHFHVEECACPVLRRENASDDSCMVAHKFCMNSGLHADLAPPQELLVLSTDDFEPLLLLLTASKKTASASTATRDTRKRRGKPGAKGKRAAPTHTVCGHGGKTTSYKGQDESKRIAMEIKASIKRMRASCAKLERALGTGAPQDPQMHTEPFESYPSWTPPAFQTLPWESSVNSHSNFGVSVTPYTEENVDDITVGISMLDL